MLPAKLKRTFDELGLANGALYLADRVLQRLSGGRARIIRYQFFAQPVPQTAPPPATGKCQVHIVSADDPIVREFPRPPQVIARRFADGATCFVAQMGERFAGFLWIARDAYEEDEVRCRFELVPASICAWDFDVYVEPDFRIGRSFSRLWQTANAHLAAQGVQWSLSRISAFNPASLAAHRRLGIRPLSTATFIVLGPVQISFVPDRTRVNLHNRPIIRLLAPSPDAPGPANAA